MMLSPFFIQAQMLDPVSYTVTEAPEEVKSGESFTITVQADIEGDWHLYSVNNNPDAGPYPTQFSSANKDLTITGEIEETEPAIEMDPNFNTELGWHSKKALFTIPLVFDEKTSGSSMVDLEVLYQVCDDKTCLPPRTKSIIHAVTIRDIPGSPVKESQEAEAADSGSASIPE